VLCVAVKSDRRLCGEPLGSVECERGQVKVGELGGETTGFQRPKVTFCEGARPLNC